MSKRPNILLIITHDTGRHIGCYGRSAATPQLDRLAEQGVLFEQAFCTAPQCSPSRASIITGRWPHNNGMTGLAHRGFRLNEDEKTLPAILAAAGWTTYLFGFQHEAPDPVELGYTNVHQDRQHGHSCVHVAPKVKEFLQSRPDESFFASVGFSETHRPYPRGGAPLDSVKPPPYLPDHPLVRQDVVDLEVLVRRVDTAVGEIIAALDASGLADNTLVIFTTDHGIAFPRAKATLFDPGVETALLMRFPDGGRAGKRIDAPVINMDIFPTVLEFAGVDLPAGVQGESLFPLIRGRKRSLHEELFFELTCHAAYDPMRAVRTSRFKYIRSYVERPFAVPPNVDAGHAKELVKSLGWFTVPRPKEQLYDLRDDPCELCNVAGREEYAKALGECRRMLEDWMRETDDPLVEGGVPLGRPVKITPHDAYDPAERVADVAHDVVPN